MARFARIVVPGYAYHVTHRGNRREDVFFDEEDREVYKKWLKEYADQYGFGDMGVLSDEKPGASSCVSKERGCAGGRVRSNADAVCAVCEPQAGLERTSLGESILFNGAG
jgi:hypothetical protein